MKWRFASPSVQVAPAWSGSSSLRACCSRAPEDSGALTDLLLMKSLAATDLAMPIPITMDPELGTGLVWFAASAASSVVSSPAWCRHCAPRVQAKPCGSRIRCLAFNWDVGGRSATDSWLRRPRLLPLLIIAALLIRSMVIAGRIDVGFEASNVTAFTTGTSAIGYDNLRAQRFYASALDAIRRLPEVQEASLVWRTPFDLTFYQDPILLPDRHTSNDQVVPTERTIVSSEYFATLGIRIIEGRNFGPLDTLDSPRVAIVNQSMARRYWPTGSAVGQRFRIGSLTGPEHLIVGVSADYKVRTVGEPPTPYIHFAQSQRLDDEWTILVKSRAGFSAPVEAVHRVLANLETCYSGRTRWTPSWRPCCCRHPQRHTVSGSQARWLCFSPPSDSTALSPSWSRNGRTSSASDWRSARKVPTGYRTRLATRPHDGSRRRLRRRGRSGGCREGTRRSALRSRSRRSARLADGVCCGDWNLPPCSCGARASSGDGQPGGFIEG